jgi:hypothetical protein
MMLHAIATCLPIRKLPSWSGRAAGRRGRRVLNVGELKGAGRLTLFHTQEVPQNPLLSPSESAIP